MKTVMTSWFIKRWIISPIRGNIIQKSHWLNVDNSWLDSAYIYDTYGNATHIIDPAGDTVSYIYDSVFHTFPAFKLSPPNETGVSLVHQYEFDARFGVIAKMVGPNSDTLILSYDGLGRPTKVSATGPLNKTYDIAKVSYTFNDSLGYAEQSEHLMDWYSGKTTRTTEFMDGLLRNYLSTSMVDKSTSIIYQKEFNSDDRTILQYMPYFTDSIPKGSIRITYDPNGRITRIVRPQNMADSSVTEIEYLGKSLSILRGAGTSDSTRATFFYEYYNSSKSIVKKITASDYNGCSQQWSMDTTYFDYDVLGRSIGAYDPQHIANFIDYNSLNRKTAFQTESFGTVNYNFDDKKRILTTIDQSGDTTSLYYDALDRLIRKELPQGEGAITYLYDLPQNAHAQGRLARVIMPFNQDSIQYDFTYDVMGNRDTVRLIMGGETFTQVQQYNPDGSPSLLVYPDSARLRYTYSRLGIDSINLLDYGSDSPEWTNFMKYHDHNAKGQVTRAIYGNGVNGNYSYFPMGNLSGMTVTSRKDQLLDFTYDWSMVNLLENITDGLSAASSQAFTYDYQGRLKSAAGVYGAKDYCYDPSGNMIKKDSVNYIYENYQVVSGINDGQDTVFNAKYDVDGNMISGIAESDTTSYTYNSQNQLDFDHP